ncbi:phage baseplate assembly protein V [Cohnella sp. GCM10027633]|uniref:phage baseplate assembly protein V n=1 Tax=unclassified Cohnella TaxID=2636738 RepID=UPI0036269B6A
MSSFFPMGQDSSPSSGSAGTINGVMVATVTNINDPEKLGRVKLKFPVRENEHETDWAPIASMMTGSAMGTMFIPDVGDEVLVAFHLGHLNQPFVIGSLWNSQKKPPTYEQTNKIRKIQTKKGHELIFDDNDSAAKITLKTPDGHKIEFDDQKDTIKMLTSTGNQEVSVTGGSSGNVTVKCGSSKIEITQTGDITINATKAVTIKGPQISVEATAKLSLAASGAVEIKSDGLLTLKGAMVKIN